MVADSGEKREQLTDRIVASTSQVWHRGMRAWVARRLQAPAVPQHSPFSDLVHDESKSRTVRDMELPNHLRHYRSKCEQVPEPFDPVFHDCQLPLRRSGSHPSSSTPSHPPSTTSKLVPAKAVDA